jgi:hypothetical protein
MEAAAECKSGEHAIGLVNISEGIPYDFQVIILDKAQLCDVNVKDYLSDGFSLFPPKGTGGLGAQASCGAISMPPTTSQRFFFTNNTLISILH